MKTKILLALALLSTTTILVLSSASAKKINTDNIKIDFKGIYMEDPNDPKCLAAILAEARQATSSILQEGDAPIYKHCPKCETGVFLPDKDDVNRCTFCGSQE
jgi:BioD-like phosphotransacetylase family protein